MDYQTLYRRWRPRRFSDFVGQRHIVTTLENAITGERLAHAYLFTGPRGTGKTSIAKILAKALNCEAKKGAEPCDECQACLRINEGTFLDVLEIDGASNRGIDEIRDLREKVKFAPAEGKFKIYIIDEVHMLTVEAFNALLKTLEEPPQFVVFILATTEIHKIPATILSRCQRFDFKRFTIPEIQGRLAQIITAEAVQSSDAALELIATHAEGGMRDALSLLEQALAHSQGRLEEANVRAILGLIDTEEIAHVATALLESRTNDALSILYSMNQDGKDLFQFGRSLVYYFRNALLEGLTKEKTDSGFSPTRLVEMIEILATATNEVKRSQQGALPLELAFIKLTVACREQHHLEARVARLEAMLRDQAVQPDKSAPVPKAPAAETAPQPTKTSSTLLPPEPKPAVAAPPPKIATTGSTFDWNGYLEAVKKRKRTLAALIQEGTLMQFGDGKMVVGIPVHLKFHLENLSSPDNKALLENIYAEWDGGTVNISCVPLPETGAVKETKAAEPDLLSQTIAIFGGEARPVKKEDNEQ